jgi:hydroxyacylglutathione hydrolase
MIEVHQFPCLSDNYGFLVHDRGSGRTATIDTPDPRAILNAAIAKGWRVDEIWNTHWHPDHAGGNAEVIAATEAKVTGPAEIERVAAAPDTLVKDGDVVALGATQARVIEVGGHTLGHIAYVFDEARIAFVGDTLFSLGCGRLFEGTPQQMWASLSKLAALPEDFTLYCAHEYTEANARFALSVDPGNVALKARASEVADRRAAGMATVPMLLKYEMATNPFLRAPKLKGALGLEGAEDWEAFAEIRRRKDNF